MKRSISLYLLYLFLLIHLSCNKKRTVNDISVYSQVQKQIQEVEKDAVETTKKTSPLHAVDHGLDSCLFSL
jgi:hypothetical protein